VKVLRGAILVVCEVNPSTACYNIIYHHINWSEEEQGIGIDDYLASILWSY
jgi:hypothetical protein